MLQQPPDYSFDPTVNFTSGITQALNNNILEKQGQGMQIANTQAQNLTDQQAYLQKRTRDMNSDLSGYASSGDYNDPSKTQQIIAKYPELAAHLADQAKNVNDYEMQTLTKNTAPIIPLLQPGKNQNIEGALDHLENIKQAYANQNNQKMLGEVNDLQSLIKQNPKVASQILALHAGVTTAGGLATNAAANAATLGSETQKAQGQANVATAQGNAEPGLLAAQTGLTNAQTANNQAGAVKTASETAYAGGAPLPETRAVIRQSSQTQSDNLNKLNMIDGLEKEAKALISSGKNTGGLMQGAVKTLGSKLGFSTDYNTMSQQFNQLKSSLMSGDSFGSDRPSHALIGFANEGMPPENATPAQISEWTGRMKKLITWSNDLESAKQSYYNANQMPGPARSNISLAGMTFPAGTSETDILSSLVNKADSNRTMQTLKNKYKPTRQ